jgi:hypothetical protein
MTDINHFQFIGQVARGPRSYRARGRPPAVKIKLVDPGSPVEQVYQLDLMDGLMDEADWIREGQVVYVEGRVGLELWQHPQTGDDLATLYIDARYVSQPPATARKAAQDTTDDPLIGTVVYIWFDDDTCTLSIESDGQRYGLHLSGEIVHKLITVYAGDQVVIEPGHPQPSVERQGDTAFVRLDADWLTLERRWQEARSNPTLNVLSLSGTLKHPPRQDTTSDGRDVAILTIVSGDSLFTVYTYDGLAREASALHPDDPVFVSGVLSLEDNRSGIGMRYRLRVDAFDLGDPENHAQAAKARAAIARRAG